MITPIEFVLIVWEWYLFVAVIIGIAFWIGDKSPSTDGPLEWLVFFVVRVFVTVVVGLFWLPRGVAWTQKVIIAAIRKSLK